MIQFEFPREELKTRMRVQVVYLGGDPRSRKEAVVRMRQGRRKSPQGALVTPASKWASLLLGNLGGTAWHVPWNYLCEG